MTAFIKNEKSLKGLLLHTIILKIHNSIVRYDVDLHFHVN